MLIHVRVCCAKDHDMWMGDPQGPTNWMVCFESGVMDDAIVAFWLPVADVVIVSCL
jgi:hypothetical protein